RGVGALARGPGETQLDELVVVLERHRGGVFDAVLSVLQGAEHGRHAARHAEHPAREIEVMRTGVREDTAAAQRLARAPGRIPTRRTGVGLRAKYIETGHGDAAQLACRDTLVDRAPKRRVLVLMTRHEDDARVAHRAADAGR